MSSLTLFETFQTLKTDKLYCFQALIKRL